MPRLFFALQPEPAQLSAIAAAVLPIVQALDARTVTAANLHLTLAFLGEVAAETIPGLLRAAARTKPLPIRLSLTHLDCWAESRVLCLLPDDSPGLQAATRLAQGVDVAARTAGIAPDKRPFRAHVTVARKVSAAARARRWPEQLPVPLPFTADGFVLMESTRETEGERYRAIHAWPAAPTDM